MYIVSFCHGYQNDDVEIKREFVPALLLFTENDIRLNEVKSLYFPRVHDDFYNQVICKNLIGEYPLENSPTSFVRLPRFGVMGLAKQDDKIYCATWNGIYVLNKNSLSVESFISHRLICDPHGIDIEGNLLFTVLTSLDLVVITNTETGEIVDYFSIDRSLNIIRNKEILIYDWRFISKQNRGAVGYWHFNHIRVEQNKIFLTSRLASCLVEIDLKSETCQLRTICWDTPVMIHDGILSSTGEIVFTSVDGKILICDTPEKMETPLRGIDNKEFHPLMKRDLVNNSIRLGDILGREVNWCRGIFDNVHQWITTIDGRYDQERPHFSVCFISKANTRDINFHNVNYELLDFPDKIKYMTGFDIEKI